MTIADLEGVFIGDAAELMVKGKMSLAKSGSNPDLAGPIDSALRRAGIVPAIFGQPQDSDVSLVADAVVPLIQALVKSEGFYKTAARIAKVDQSTPESGQKQSQYFDQAMQLGKLWEERAAALGAIGATPDGVAPGNVASGRMKPVNFDGIDSPARDSSYRYWDQ